MMKTRLMRWSYALLLIAIFIFLCSGLVTTYSENTCINGTENYTALCRLANNYSDDSMGKIVLTIISLLVTAGFLFGFSSLVTSREEHPEGFVITWDNRRFFIKALLAMIFNFALIIICILGWYISIYGLSMGGFS